RLIWGLDETADLHARFWPWADGSTKLRRQLDDGGQGAAAVARVEKARSRASSTRYGGTRVPSNRFTQPVKVQHQQGGADSRVPLRSTRATGFTGLLAGTIQIITHGARVHGDNSLAAVQLPHGPASRDTRAPGVRSWRYLGGIGSER